MSEDDRRGDPRAAGRAGHHRDPAYPPRRAFEDDPVAPAPVHRWALIGPRERLLGIVLAATVVAALLIAAITTNDRQTALPPVPDANVPVFPAPAAPSPPVSVLPAPSASLLSVAGAGPSPSRSTSAPATRDPATARTNPPAAVTLVVGSNANLEVRNLPGVRLRHHDFLAKTDPLSTLSGEPERADFRFRVRRGLDPASCFTLEAFNYPGFYLRNRGLVLGIAPRDGTYADSDATLCPVTTKDGGAIALRAAGQPGRYLVARNGGAYFDQVPVDQATAFLVKPAM